LLAALVSTGYSAWACLLGWRNHQSALRRSGLLAGVAGFLAISAVVGSLSYGLVVKDYRFAYVAQYSSHLLPWHYSISSLWVGQAGSLLLWTWFCAALALVFRVLHRCDADADGLRDLTFGVLMAFCGFLVAAMVFAADPMAPSIAPPHDGDGLSPILQHPSMLIHPPIVFLGYAAWTIPFALAVAALVSGQLSCAWARVARPWALFAWMVLGGGILVGAHWAYEELGWGGYWAWDPVENGSLLPWLIGTTAIHSLMAWRHRGMLKKTALTLTIATFALCNFATFLTRSGIFSSLHAFSQSPIGWLFLGLMAAIVVGGGFLIATRRELLHPERSVSRPLCREAMVVTTTLALVTLAIIVCAGTLSTAISEVLVGRKIVLGMAFYNNALIPTAFFVLLLMGAAPLVPWGRSPSQPQLRWLCGAISIGCLAAVASCGWGVRDPIWFAVNGLAVFSVATLAGALWLDASRRRHGRPIGFLRTVRLMRRQYAGFVIHLGLFSLAVGVTASSLGTQRREVVMYKGESLAWAGRRVQLIEFVQRELPDKLVVEARLDVQDKVGRRVLLAPAQHFHFRQKAWTTEIGNDTSWHGDFYTILHSGDEAEGVRLTFVLNPMMRWIWLGGWTMAGGSGVALWPKRRARARSKIRSAEAAWDEQVERRTLRVRRAA
jgi:cytochrome c-type biogenesis protein CcmF